MNERNAVDSAIQLLSVALIVVGAAPALIAAAILGPLLIWTLAGWSGIALSALLCLILVAPPSRLLRGPADRER